jgi:diketogulonate reductase-like aldo/keto reductase
VIPATNDENVDERMTTLEKSAREDYFVNTKVMNQINDNVNTNVAIKLYEIQIDVKYDELYQ